jgi:hypothetical protein
MPRSRKPVVEVNPLFKLFVFFNALGWLVTGIGMFAIVCMESTPATDLQKRLFDVFAGAFFTFTGAFGGAQFTKHSRPDVLGEVSPTSSRRNRGRGKTS